MEEIPKIYDCDPQKNTECTKESCHKNGGPCHKTSNPEYAKSVTTIIEEVQEDMCNYYCRYTNEAKAAIDNQEDLDRICGNCPLNRL